MLFVSVAAMLTLCACGGRLGGPGNRSARSVSSGSIDVSGGAVNATGAAVSGGAVTMKISVGKERGVVIPDPATAGREIEISLSSEEGCDAEEESGYARKKERYLADMSFAGFENKVFVTSYAVGYMAQKDSSTVQIVNEDKGKTKTKKGNCLAVHVVEDPMLTVDMSIYDDEGRSINDDKNYLVVIDYANRSCFRMKTNFDSGGFYYEWPDMRFADLTEDGGEELVIEAVHNKWVDCEIYRYDAESRKTRRIFDTYGQMDRECLSAELVENYRVQLKYKGTDYKETLSLLDREYTREDLELGQGNADPSYDATHFARVWKNGVPDKESIKEIVEPDDYVGLYVPEDIRYEVSSKGVPQIRTASYMYLGHRSCHLGYLCVYYQYDNKKEKFVPVLVECLKEFEQKTTHGAKQLWKITVY